MNKECSTDMNIDQPKLKVDIKEKKYYDGNSINDEEVGDNSKILEENEGEYNLSVKDITDYVKEIMPLSMKSNHLDEAIRKESENLEKFLLEKYQYICQPKSTKALVKEKNSNSNNEKEVDMNPKKRSSVGKIDIKKDIFKEKNLPVIKEKAEELNPPKQNIKRRRIPIVKKHNLLLGLNQTEKIIQQKESKPEFYLPLIPPFPQGPKKISCLQPPKMRLEQKCKSIRSMRTERCLENTINQLKKISNITENPVIKKKKGRSKSYHKGISRMRRENMFDLGNFL